MKITVVRNHSAKSPGARRFNVGRGKGLALGNPYRIDVNGRGVSVAKYRMLLLLVLRNEQSDVEYFSVWDNAARAKAFDAFVAIVVAAQTTEVELGCWCRDDRDEMPEADLAFLRAMAPCHADVIKEFLERWRDFPPILERISGEA